MLSEAKHPPNYQLLDSGNFLKLEQVGLYRLVRPAAGAVWRPSLPDKEWNAADASFHRREDGNGKWVVKSKLPPEWTVAIEGITFKIRPTDFGHLGIFAEQMSNWNLLTKIPQDNLSRLKEFRVLNLFAYTGGSSLASAQGGAHVVHLDASKTSVAWARENAEVSGLADKPIRWIVDDVKKFVAREIKRGSVYHGIILDPPSYGKGKQGEVWKIETDLPDLLQNLTKILDPKAAFIMLSSHSTGYTPIALGNLIAEVCPGFATEAFEMTLTETSGRMLPSGACALAWNSKGLKVAR
jgi:23S rRNA (cytosine1962-C5)-methyltransferase